MVSRSKRVIDLLEGLKEEGPNGRAVKPEAEAAPEQPVSEPAAAPSLFAQALPEEPIKAVAETRRKQGAAGKPGPEKTTIPPEPEEFAGPGMMWKYEMGEWKKVPSGYDPGERPIMISGPN